MSSKPRDTQRSAVYAWERLYGGHWQPLGALSVCEAFVRKVWRLEARRYGIGECDAPAVLRPHRGQRRALACCSKNEIRLPVWARAAWITLHELAHILNGAKEPHGSRFVGILIGMLRRQAGYDRRELVASARAHGVEVDERSIGATPDVGLPTLPEQLLALAPISMMDAACELDIPYKAVFCGYMTLKRQGYAHIRRGKIVAQPTSCIQED
jgi:hypothetical protein